jgi:AcrR family transcriptional regulator
MRIAVQRGPRALAPAAPAARTIRHDCAVPPRLPRSPRLAPELRRRQIIDATLRVAERRGFSALTVEAIAGEAGITRPVVYDLFGELDGLLRATLQDTLEQTLNAVQELLPQRLPDARPQDVVHDVLLRFLTVVGEQPQRWRLVLLPSRGAPAGIRAGVEHNRAEVLARAVPLVQWGLRELGVSGIDPVMVARLLMATGEDMARLALERPGRYSPGRIAGAVRGLTRLLPDPGAEPGEGGRP